MKLRILVAALGVVVAACGKVKPAARQSAPALTPPPFADDAGEAFSLADGRAVGNFSASLIFWKPKVTPPLIQAVSQASVGGRRVKAETLAFVAETLVPARAAVEAAERGLAEVDARIAKAEAIGFVSPHLQRETRAITDQWFEGRLEELLSAGEITEAARDHARTAFGAYCDAKIWDFAIGPLAQLTYDTRPTPHAMCEPYYASRQYFADADLCGPGSGRDYFACLWLDGVFKTANFLAPSSGRCSGAEYSSPQAAIEAWFSTGLLRAVLSDTALFDVRTYAQTMRDLILDGSTISAQGIPRRAEYAAFTGCRAAFKRTLVYSEGDMLALELWPTAAVRDLLTIVEANSVDATPFRLLPDADDANFNRLTKYVKVFGYRYKTNAAELPASYSDYLFNHPSDGRTLEINGQTAECDIVGRAGSQRCLEDADPAFRRFAELKRLFVAPEEWAAQAELSQKVTSAAQAVADAESALVTHEENIKQSTLDGVIAVNADGATLYFNSFDLQLVKDQGDLSVTLSLKDGSENARSPLFGCVSTDGSDRACESPVTRPDGSVDLQSLSFDPARGRLAIRVAIQDPEGMGFGYRMRTTGTGSLSQAFNDLPPSAYEGRTLDIEMFANTLGGRLGFFTGDARILDGDTTHIVGSVSGDDFSQAKAMLLGPR